MALEIQKTRSVRDPVFSDEAGRPDAKLSKTAGLIGASKKARGLGVNAPILVRGAKSQDCIVSFPKKGKSLN